MSVPDYPQNLPANTVVGRLAIGPGPTEAIPIASLPTPAGPATPPAAQMMFESVAGPVASWTTTPDISGALSSVPATILNGANCANSYKITSDNLDASAGASTLVGQGVQYTWGGSGVKGQRFARMHYLQQVNGITSAANGTRTYVAGTDICYTGSGDGGTGTGVANSKGIYQGGNSLVIADSGAANINTLNGHEANVFSRNGGSTYNFGYVASSYVNAASHGVNQEAAYLITAATSGVYVGDGWTNGFLFSDVSGNMPVNVGSTIMRGQWLAHANPTIVNGIDLTAFNFSGSAFSSNGFRIDNSGGIKGSGQFITAGPRAVTAGTDTVAATDITLLFNFAGTVTETLPSATTFVGRWLYVRTVQGAANSASANVIPLIGGAAGTAILPATPGKWALLQADGTNWQITAAN